MKKKNWKLLKNKKGIGPTTSIGFIGSGLILNLGVVIAILIIIAIVFGIPLAGITFFLIKNGKLVLIIIAVLIVLKLFSKK